MLVFHIILNGLKQCSVNDISISHIFVADNHFFNELLFGKFFYCVSFSLLLSDSRISFGTKFVFCVSRCGVGINEMNCFPKTLRQFCQHLMLSFYAHKSQKDKKTDRLTVFFCTFGILAHKSFA